MQAINITPKLTGSQTSALLKDQGYTYNQAGLTYNQSGVDYGGLYKVNQDFIPILTQAKTITPSLTVQDTLKKQVDQGYTYNQIGFSYNQSGVDYGGLYNLFDVTPIISMAKNIITRMAIGGDFINNYAPAKKPKANALNGPGWFMFINL